MRLRLQPTGRKLRCLAALLGRCAPATLLIPLCLSLSGCELVTARSTDSAGTEVPAASNPTSAEAYLDALQYPDVPALPPAVGAALNSTSGILPDESAVHDADASQKDASEEHRTAAQAIDLVARIRRGFQLEHHTDHPRVQAELRWFDRHPQYLVRLRTRMQTLLPHVVDHVDRRGLPMELALLPIIESALDAYAFSPTGAAGIWQFMPATGRRFGLTNDAWYDGRRDLHASTRAALDYLELLHTRFDDWLLAVAGYNAGEGNVSRATRRAAPGTPFFELRLPRETAQYVPRLLALAAVVDDPEITEMEIPPLDDAPFYAAIDTGSQLELAAAAEVLNLTVDDLYKWNPALESWSTPPAGPHRPLDHTS